MLQQDNGLLPLRLSSIPITCLLGMNGFFMWIIYKNCSTFHVTLINSGIERVRQSATFSAD